MLNAGSSSRSRLKGVERRGAVNVQLLVLYGQRVPPMQPTGLQSNFMSWMGWNALSQLYRHDQSYAFLSKTYVLTMYQARVASNTCTVPVPYASRNAFSFTEVIPVLFLGVIPASYAYEEAHEELKWRANLGGPSGVWWKPTLCAQVVLRALLAFELEWKGGIDSRSGDDGGFGFLPG
ncbi:hypothetical protein BDQ17DRAFT_1335904 [Cyathus striatus]|nr:hypothetical protein BDQ17DRAFT_1335904 [Cyathus striatus]